MIEFFLYQQVQVLTILPKSWSVAKTREVFVNASDSMVLEAKELVKEKGELLYRKKD